MEQNSLDKIIDDLRSKDIDQAVEAIYRLEKIADESHLPQLEQLLQDSNFFIREATAGPYAKIMGIRALPLLLQAQLRGYEDNHDNDGLDAVIIELVETHEAEATPLLMELLRSQNSESRAQAAWLLGFVASQIEPTPLVDALHDKSSEVRANAAGALSSFEGYPGVFEALSEALKDQDEQVRVSVASALGYLGDKRALPILRNALQDASERVRHITTHAIKHLEKSSKFTDTKLN
jgi:HEAT repeat protein